MILLRLQTLSGSRKEFYYADYSGSIRVGQVYKDDYEIKCHEGTGHNKLILNSEFVDIKVNCDCIDSQYHDKVHR